MSQTVITAAFEEWKAQEAAGGNRVVLDGFVLANVPGLDPDTPISNTEGMPPDSQIVYRQDVDKCGVVNNNAVVYSITLGSNIGTFDFNWIGLVNKASGVLAMIVHTPIQRKLKTEDGQQGNAINRSFLMEYDGAAQETQINTPAQTWQIDFTARLSGMDEEWRLANFDIYGPGAFFGDGFLVKKDGSKYQVQPGNGYIGGVRATLSASEEITAATLPAKVFADVSWQGALTGRWQAVTTVLSSTAELADYIDGNGFSHYVFAVASIDAAGVVTDLRPIGSIPAQVADGAVKSVSAGNSTHKPDTSGNVKLGSAADADIVTSMTDTTAGRVPVAGWMGTGGPEIPIVDGTDIYKYFATAASGNYGGGSGLINAATTGGWVGFKWQQHGAGNKYGFLLEQASSGQMALHIYNNPNGDMANPEKYWSNSGLFFKESGGTITGKLRINVDGEALRLQPKTAGYASYILSADSANANHWYVGAGAVGNADVAFNNYKGGNNSVVLKSDGTIYLNPTQGRSAIVNSPLQLGTTKKLTIESQNTSTLGAILHLWGNADRPTVIEFGDDTSYHFYSQRNKDGSISFVSPGEVVPGNYTNFDSRYLTKSENLPVGIPLPWPTATPPSGWLICNGSAFNKTSCPKLAAVYPSGNLPDLRAQFIRGLDNGKNIDTGRAILSTQAGQSPYSSVGSTYGNTSWNSRATVKTGYYMTTGTDNDGTYQIMSESQAQRETRPTNVAFNYIVRAA